MTIPHASLDYPAILQKCLHYLSGREQDVNHLPRMYLLWVFYHSWLCYEGGTSRNLDHSLSFRLSDWLLALTQTNWKQPFLAFTSANHLSAKYTQMMLIKPDCGTRLCRGSRPNSMLEKDVAPIELSSAKKRSWYSQTHWVFVVDPFLSPLSPVCPTCSTPLSPNFVDYLKSSICSQVSNEVGKWETGAERRRSHGKRAGVFMALLPSCRPLFSIMT